MLATLLLLTLTIALGGCTLMGAAANAVAGPDPSITVTPKYHGLAGQTVAIVVWADPKTRNDFPTIREGIGQSLQDTLVRDIQGEAKSEELKGTVFPAAARSVVRFQEDHPDTASQTIEQVSLRLGIPHLSRVIYVEVEKFETRDAKLPELLRGTASATLRVVEITGNTATVKYSESGIEAQFPKKEGDTLDASGNNDEAIFKGLLGDLTDHIALRFYKPTGK